MKRISIIIPVFNAEKYIQECLDSVYKQGLDDEEFEVVIVNDGSSDRSMEIVSRVASLHSNIVIINQPNQGVSIARNNGIQRAQGNYIWFVDADDILIENSLPQMLSVAESNNLDILKIRYVKFDHSPDEVVNQFDPSVQAGACKSGLDSFVDDFYTEHGCIVQFMYLREFVLANRLQFLEHINYAEDWFFVVSSLVVARRVISFPLLVYLYRQHESSAVHTFNRKSIMSLNIVAERTYRLMKEAHLNKKSKKKFVSCLYYLLFMDMFYLIDNPNLYQQRREIIKDLKSRVPCFVSFRYLREFRFSLFYNFCPSLYVKYKHNRGI